MPSCKEAIGCTRAWPGHPCPLEAVFLGHGMTRDGEGIADITTPYRKVPGVRGSVSAVAVAPSLHERGLAWSRGGVDGYDQGHDTVRPISSGVALAEKGALGLSSEHATREPSSRQRGGFRLFGSSYGEWVAHFALCQQGLMQDEASAQLKNRHITATCMAEAILLLMLDNPSRFHSYQANNGELVGSRIACCDALQCSAVQCTSRTSTRRR